MPFLEIKYLDFAFDHVDKIGWKSIKQRAFELSEYLYDKISELSRQNDDTKIVFYSERPDFVSQGPIVNINIRRNDKFIGCNEFMRLANLNRIHVRVGGFCNPGARQIHLNLEKQWIKKISKVNFFQVTFLKNF